ncbi:hypothetical protein AVEN_229042-1 [Araneus ventricosus]|uniref:BTB domain-containing protein n=1 Tax=Araneus ventricosus TaxID=182803 RepID=A0A4Y2CYN0_ARAVE|nr:hypothetical protein AVEN_229042-1 [Araneus ventricosus]
MDVEISKLEHKRKFKEIRQEIQNLFLLKRAKAHKLNLMPWPYGAIDEMGPQINLVVGKTTFFIPKVILCQASEVFYKMFQHPFNESRSNSVKINNVDELTMHRLVNYIMTKNDKINESICLNGLLRLYYAADKYCMLSLLDELRKDIKKKTTIQNIEDIKAFAEVHADSDLLKFIWYVQEVFPSMIPENDKDN